MRAAAIKTMINKKYIYAVIGASNDKQKYGHKVFKDLKDSDYQVVPVNLKEKEILGVKAVKSVLDINFKIDVAIFVIPPLITEIIMTEIKKKNIKNVWFQPGSESKKAIEYCKKNNINYISKACIMIKKQK